MLSGRKIILGIFAAMTAFGPALAEEEKKLNLYFWPAYIPEELLQRFTKETGIAITLDLYDTNEALLAKLQAGAAGYDVVIPSDYIVPTMVKAGLLQKIDAKAMANGKNIAEGFTSPSFDPDRAYTAPYTWGTTGLVYDTAKTGGELPDSWSVFFEPGPLSGKIASLDDEVEVFNAAAYYLGIDKCTETPAEAQKILDLLLKQKPDLKLYSSSATVDRVIAGEVAVHHIWNGAAHKVIDAVPTARYIYAKEGVTQWADNLAVPTTAAHPENARLFINWMMDPKNIAEVTNFAGYMNSLKGTEPYLKPELAKDAAVNMPVEFADRLRPSKECSPAARELRNKVWTKLKK
jgi:spermidine/putrescine transport system substrate-binding protein